MGGKQADAAFWYDTSSGDFISSEYYIEEQPEWLKKFNSRRVPQSYFGKLWNPLPFTDAALDSGLVVKKDRGWFTSTFPHAIGNSSPVPNAAFYSAFGGTPFMDEYLGELTETLMDAYELGQDEHTDLLLISFSVLDSVGHDHGPHSPEVVDTIVRLDRTLGRLFEKLETTVGMNRILIGFSSDHGVMDLPEYRRAHQQDGFRLSDEEIACVQREGREFINRYGADEDWFLHGFYLDYSDIGRHNLRREEVERYAAQSLMECRHIRKVWTRTELEGPPTGSPFETRYRNAFVAGRSPDLMIQHEQYFLPSSGTGTTHGSPYDYDSHVPIIFLAPGIEPSAIDSHVETADIAPTFAELLGIPLPDTVDGQSLKKYFIPSRR
jgi:arylsulfatase A-like enzyme